LRLFSFGGYGLALTALALVVFGAIEYPPTRMNFFSFFFDFPLIFLKKQNKRVGKEEAALAFRVSFYYSQNL